MWTRWKSLAPIVFGCALVLSTGCDYGDPVMELDNADEETAAARIMLMQWQAQGAIPAADVNGDGTVDILDLAIVGQNFGLDVDPSLAGTPGADTGDADVTVTSFETKQIDTRSFWNGSDWESGKVYSYKVGIRNNTVTTLEVSLTLQFFDIDEFLLDTKFVGPLSSALANSGPLAAGEEKTYVGEVYGHGSGSFRVTTIIISEIATTRG